MLKFVFLILPYSGSINEIETPNQLVMSPAKIESLSEALDTEKPQMKEEAKDEERHDDIKTVQVNLISSSGQENSPPDLNLDTGDYFVNFV